MSFPADSRDNGFTLRKRLILALGVPLIALLIVAGYALAQFSQIHCSVNTIYRDRVIPLQELKIVDSVRGDYGSV